MSTKCKSTFKEPNLLLDHELLKLFTNDHSNTLWLKRNEMTHQWLEPYGSFKRLKQNVMVLPSQDIQVNKKLVRGRSTVQYIYRSQIGWDRKLY